eukprot:scaffold248654_cov27-Tisochrysis_lutea.AAC.2
MKGELCPQDQYTTQPLQATGSQAQQGQASSSNNTDSRAGSSSTGSNSSGSSNTSSRWRSKAGDEAFWLRQRSALLSLPLTDGYGGRAGAGAAAEDQVVPLCTVASSSTSGAGGRSEPAVVPVGACTQLHQHTAEQGWEGVCHTKQGRRSSEGCCIWGTECALLYAVYGHSRFGCFRDTAGLNAYGHSRLGCLRDSAGLGAYGTQQTWVLMGHSRLGCLRDAAGLGAATHG